MSDSLVVFFAQVTNTAGTTAGAPDASAGGPPAWTNLIFFAIIFIMVYFAFFGPQIQAQKKKEETVKSAKTGDKIVTSSGIHGVIANVKDATVIVKVADNVKLEIEKSHIEKITRDSSASDSEKTVTAKVS